MISGIDPFRPAARQRGVDVCFLSVGGNRLCGVWMLVCPVDGVEVKAPVCVGGLPLNLYAPPHLRNSKEAGLSSLVLSW